MVQRSRSVMRASNWWRRPSGPLWTARCLRQAADLRNGERRTESRLTRQNRFPLSVFRFNRPLQAAHGGQTHLGCQEGVFAEGLHAASPARVAEYVDVRSEEGDACVVAILAFSLRLAVLAHALVGNAGVDFVDQFGVEGGGEGYWHRVDRGDTVAGDAVQGLVPPAVGLDSESRDGRVLVLEESQFFVECQPRDEVVDTLFDRQRGVLEGELLCSGAKRK